QQVIAASKSGDWSVGDDGTVTCGGRPLVDGEYTLQLVASSDGYGAGGGLRCGGDVRLGTELTDGLRAAGLVADVTRVIQQARKEAGREVSDRVSVTVDAPEPVWAAVSQDADRVRAETLATTLRRGPVDDGAATTGSVGDGE